MNRQEQIDEVMDHFDFEKVHKVMTALEWTYWDTDGVPELFRLRRTARKLLNYAMDDAEKTELVSVWYSTGTGGFNVSSRKVETGAIRLKMNFEISSWEVSSEDGQ